MRFGGVCCGLQADRHLRAAGRAGVGRAGPQVKSTARPRQRFQLFDITHRKLHFVINSDVLLSRPPNDLHLGLLSRHAGGPIESS